MLTDWPELSQKAIKQADTVFVYVMPNCWVVIKGSTFKDNSSDEMMAAIRKKDAKKVSIGFEGEIKYCNFDIKD